MAQTAVCNRHHTLDQQLCRWLLLSLDRLNGNELVMTQELIANMLGVRREGVTESALKLQKAGLIRYARGRIEVLDRPGLEPYLQSTGGVDRWWSDVGRSWKTREIKLCASPHRHAGPVEICCLRGSVQPPLPCVFGFGPQRASAG